MNAGEGAPLLECRGVGKSFGAITALADVDLTIRAGEVHGLVGSNGAGKSTLTKILAGAFDDYRGVVSIGGEIARLNSPQAARRHGIAMVYQELSGVGQLTVAENLFLGRQPVTRWGCIDWRAIRGQAREQLAELNIDLDVDRRLDRFPLVARQMVEIARGLHSGARILILDEPTSALSPPEADRLFDLLAALRRRGVAMIFISHFLEDVLRLCDRVTILKDGRKVSTRAAAEVDKHQIIRAMLGHSGEQAEVGYETAATLPPAVQATPVLQARELSLPGAFERVNLHVAPGECLGLFGFAGAGHQELLHCLAGAIRPAAGQTSIDGRPLKPGSTPAAIRRGVVLVAADRAKTVFRRAEIYKNVTLAHLSAAGRWLTRAREARVCDPLLKRVGCRPANGAMLAGRLSGGNQQKTVFARWLAGPMRVLLLDEPTRGMDVGAKDEIMALVARLQSQNVAVVLASTEPELLLARASRIVVMSRGRVSREFADCRVDKAGLLRHA